MPGVVSRQVLLHMETVTCFSFKTSFWIYCRVIGQNSANQSSSKSLYNVYVQDTPSVLQLKRTGTDEVPYWVRNISSKNILRSSLYFGHF